VRDRTIRERQSYSPWRGPSPPRRILIIRLHALGDVALTLPASLGLRARYPGARIDFLTSEPAASLLRSLAGFDQVHAIPSPTDAGTRLIQAIRWGTYARRMNYDLILDLQRNWMTRTVRRLARPASWGEFDRFSPRPASERVMETFRRSGFTDVSPAHEMCLRKQVRLDALLLLRDHGFSPGKRLILLNPGGLWETRNWPVGNYVALAGIWLRREPVQFMLVGTERMREKAAQITRHLGSAAVNLVGRSTPGVAFAVLQHADAVITEDSGLMHMAWSSGIPTVALFGSGNHVWSAPTGNSCRVFHSGDLPCGQCMSPVCRYGDVRCLTRLTPEVVFSAAAELLAARERIGEPA